MALAELDPMLLLQAVEGRGDVRRQRPKALLPSGGEERPQLRAVQECRLAADWHELIEDQDKGGRDQAYAHRAKRGAAKAIAEACLGADGFVDCHPRHFSECHAMMRKTPKNSSQFCVSGEDSFESICGDIIDIAHTASGIAIR